MHALAARITDGITSSSPLFRYMYQCCAHATPSCPEHALSACTQTHATHSAGHQHRADGRHHGMLIA
eukprot:4943766-Pleurochrysis_carterae.AAC.1